MESKSSKRKKKKTKKKSTKSRDKRSKSISKREDKSSVRVESNLQPKRVSEVSNEELRDKYLVSLPKDNCKDPEEYLRTQGYVLTDEFLGQGGFGHVLKAIKYENSSKVEIAVKVLDMSSDESKARKRMVSLKNELLMVKTTHRIRATKHDHIIRFYDCFVIEYKDIETNQQMTKAFIFMELSKYGNLEKELEISGPMTDSTAKRYFVQILYAIEYMHGVGIAHRDLKLENVLLFKSKSVPNLMDIKVSDFGLTRIHYTEETGFVPTFRTGGTSPYKSPEILKLQLRLTDKLLEPFKADIWALGVCLFRMFYYNYPFDTTDLRKAIECQERKKFGFSNSIFIERSAKDLIQRLLEPDINKRLSIYAIKTHPWVESEISLTHTLSER